MSELIGKIKEKGIRQSVRMISVKMKKQEKWDVKNLRGKRKNAIDKLLSREFVSRHRLGTLDMDLTIITGMRFSDSYVRKGRTGI